MPAFDPQYTQIRVVGSERICQPATFARGWSLDVFDCSSHLSSLGSMPQHVADSPNGPAGRRSRRGRGRDRGRRQRDRPGDPPPCGKRRPRSPPGAGIRPGPRCGPGRCRQGHAGLRREGRSRSSHHVRVHGRRDPRSDHAAERARVRLGPRQHPAGRGTAVPRQVSSTGVHRLAGRPARAPPPRQRVRDGAGRLQVVRRQRDHPAGRTRASPQRRRARRPDRRPGRDGRVRPQRAGRVRGLQRRRRWRVHRHGGRHRGAQSRLVGHRRFADHPT